MTSAAGPLPANGMPWVPMAVDSARGMPMEGAVHVWRADLDALVGQFEGLLDHGELDRAERIVREPARRRWMAARGALRALLGACVEEHPTALRFAQCARGKPVLDELPGLHFNVAHSAGLAVYALTKICPVGVDVELLARPTGRRHRRDFLREWVHAEAEGKRTGMGIGNTPRQARTGDSTPWISELNLGRDAVGAIALSAPPVDFQVYAMDF